MYDMVMEGGRNTVVAEYTPDKESYHSDHYQSEAQLEASFIQQLEKQGYEYLTIHHEEDLISNLRRKLEELNHIQFSDKEWNRFFKGCIANEADGIVEKTRKIQQDYIQLLRRDDGSTKNIYLLDKEHIHNNKLQVINQYEEEKGSHKTRYDVTILVNGLPLVHVELKRRGVSIRQAFNQIERYQRDSFWAASGLYEYVQIFVISNGTDTKYYSNTTRDSHIKEETASGRKKSRKTSNSFEFTSHWADGRNRNIFDLVDFTKTFFSKHTLLSILTRYCIFTTENILMIMRPYQIAATEAILNRIEVSNNYKQMGTVKAGGYIWHTTGSGKTLTSFKTARLATELPYIDKVLFVVDRKDLDYQTIKEYDRFQKGAANGNRNTKILTKQLEDPKCRIIITTIQKLDSFIKKNKAHEVYKKHIVMIFDECHRSQFGDMHQAIAKHFRNYHIFGFTGTPIFAANANKSGNLRYATTEQVFGDRLHTYTIVDAIRDKNVLPFRIDYVNTMKEKPGLTDSQVEAIDRKKALEAPKRVSEIVKYVLDHFDQKTNRSIFYALKGQRVNGFNSIFAAESIPMVKKYYVEFKKQMRERGKHLTIATIFSYAPNEEAPGHVISDEDFDTSTLDQSSRDFLESAIEDYNETFQTNFSTDNDSFENYYKDISQRMKKREIDMLLVVNMFLTGFDATTLNTLWVDKNLKQHGLIQAFSRTNRILNSVKTFGNIVCFRNLEKETDDALALFGDRNARGVVILKDFKSYFEGYKDENGEPVPGYKALVMLLRSKFPMGEEITSEAAQKEFIRLFGKILRLRNILRAFDQFEGYDIMAERELQDYQSLYIDLYEDWKPRGKEKEDINDDIVFEMELVRQVEVNIDYILSLVQKYHDGHRKDKELLGIIDKAMDSSLELRSKKELIHGFIKEVDVAPDEPMNVADEFHKYVAEEKEKELDSLIQSENLKPEETKSFMANSFLDGEISTIGTGIDKLMPPMSRFGFGGSDREGKKHRIIDKLKAFFNKYLGI